ncbi:MAG: HupE/UreJ family protein [Anaerolineae bacterium]|nr:HupE/UreJ family protein [Gloeobacterales cyanobacterium ES-bin-313]
MGRLVLFFALFITGLLGNWLPAWAHKPSDSYLNLDVKVGQVIGRWDIALRDLDYAIGLDGNGDGTITWGELRAQTKTLNAYALSHLQLRSEGVTCPTQSTGLQVDSHSDGAYAVLHFKALCSKPTSRLALTYSLLFDLDPQHRGLLNVKSGDTNHTAIFSSENSEQDIELNADGLQQFFAFGREGVWHIWQGYDHILFLLTLLIPAVLERKEKRWQPVQDLPTAFGNVLKVVTAFTLAHSLTLTLATLQIVQLPSRLVESAIAISVVLAALNNLYPLFQGRIWLIAFCFGLIHGFGFASVLADLGLPQGTLLLALVGFNLGVEVGQLAIVAAFLPIAFVLRRSWFYHRITLLAGSSAIAVIACVWLLERVFDFKVLAF